MDNTLNDANAIVAGILADADAEAARIIADAEAYAAASAARAAEQDDTITRETRAKADSLSAGILADAKSKANVERRKRTLQSQESLSQDIVEKATRRLAESMAAPGYRDTLRRWIVEAAIGLSVESAIVNASMDELPLIDDALLRQAEAEVLAETGKATRLRKLEGDPHIGQGVSLLADGGRLAYDNRVATRLDRNRTEIKKLVYAALFDSRRS